jgi:hypothetical protein
MLDIPKRFPGSVMATCDESGCRASVRVDAMSLDDARAKLEAMNWMKGKGAEGVHWACPSRKPLLKPRATSTGPSVWADRLRPGTK